MNGWILVYKLPIAVLGECEQTVCAFIFICMINVELRDNRVLSLFCPTFWRIFINVLNVLWRKILAPYRNYESPNGQRPQTQV